jgi:hypothetical protein
VPSQLRILLTSSHILRSSLTDCVPIGSNSERRTDGVAIVQNSLKSSRTCHRHVTVADIGNAIGLLAQQVTLLAARLGGRSGNRDVIPKPKAWDGKGGSVEARHFLAAFNNYAQAQGDPLNTFNQPTNAWIINQTSWIQSVLNLMEGDA